MYHNYKICLVVGGVSPLEDPDEEDSNQSNDYGPYEDLSLINFSGWVIIIIILLYEVRLQCKQKEPNNNSNYEEPEQVKPPSVSASVVVMTFMHHALFHAFFSQAGDRFMRHIRHFVNESIFCCENFSIDLSKFKLFKKDKFKKDPLVRKIK